MKTNIVASCFHVHYPLATEICSKKSIRLTEIHSVSISHNRNWLGKKMIVLSIISVPKQIDFVEMRRSLRTSYRSTIFSIDSFGSNDRRMNENDRMRKVKNERNEKKYSKDNAFDVVVGSSNRRSLCVYLCVSVLRTCSGSIGLGNVVGRCNSVTMCKTHANSIRTNAFSILEAVRCRICMRWQSDDE